MFRVLEFFCSLFYTLYIVFKNVVQNAFWEEVMMMRLFSMVLAVGFCFLLPTASYAKRVALVIGNNAYENVSKLEKAVNDATSMGAALRKVGFTVIVKTDINRRGFNRYLQQFLSQLKAGDEALLFYAGHGVEIQGQIYLLPTDIPNAAPGQEAFVKAEAIGVNNVIDEIGRRKVRLSMLVLDACRNNPFKSSGTRSLGRTRGLGTMSEPPEGTFILYSAGFGQSALDRLSDSDPHPNSVFTRSLLPMMKQPGLKLSDAAKQLRRNVMKMAATVSHKQIPAYYDQVIGDFYFTPPPAGVSQIAPPPQQFTQQPANPYGAGTCGVWPQIATTATYAQVQAFLAECKKGIYSILARARLKELKPVGTQLALIPPVVKSPATTKKQSGNAAQIFRRAWNIYNGKNGETKDYYKAVRLYRQAAEMGHKSAKVNLGYAYENGRGVEKSYSEAFRLYTEAAKLGEAQGMTNLGYMYEKGNGTKRSLPQAFKWYGNAAKAGNYNGMTNLGYMYETGRGTSRDYGQALKWYKKASNAGTARAQNNLAYLYLNGRGTKKNSSKAMSLYKKAAANNFANSMYMIGYMTELGKGVSKNGKRAAPWVMKALKARHAFTIKEMTTNATGWSLSFRKELQRLMSNQGYYHGAIDGKFGSGTYSAVRAVAGQ